MSSGEYNYEYFKVQEFADEMLANSNTPHRAAFAEHLNKIADIMRAIEWQDSGDTDGEEVDGLIEDVLHNPGPILRAALTQARKARDMLSTIIDLTETYE